MNWFEQAPCRISPPGTEHSDISGIHRRTTLSDIRQLRRIYPLKLDLSQRNAAPVLGCGASRSRNSCSLRSDASTELSGSTRQAEVKRSAHEYTSLSHLKRPHKLPKERIGDVHVPPLSCLPRLGRLRESPESPRRTPVPPFPSEFFPCPYQRKVRADLIIDLENQVWG
jgi:hypothetical protein